MATPVLRVAPAHATTGSGGGAATTTTALTIDSSAVVGADYLVLTAAVGAGISTTTPAAHDTTVLTPPAAGWTLAGTTMQSANDTETTATWIKQVAAGDPGSSLVVTSNVGGRNAAQLTIVQNASGWQAVSSGFQQSVTTFGLPGFTLPADGCLALAVAGVRWAATATTPNPPSLTGWGTPLVDDTTTNTTGQRIGVWMASQTFGAGTSGTTIAPVSAAAPAGPSYGSTVIVFTPGGIALSVSAGPAQTVDAWSTVKLTGSSVGGSGTIASQTWTQTSGAAVSVVQSGSTATFVAKGTLGQVNRVFTYTVTDSANNTSSATVTITSRPSPFRVNVGGTLRPANLSLPAPFVPTPTVSKFFSAFPGGGGQAAAAVAWADPSKAGLGTDTGGTRLTADGTRSTFVNTSGLQGLRAKQADGLDFSSVTDGVAFMTCGDSTAGVGGVYVATNTFTATPSTWARLDGVAAATLLRFNGGNVNTTTCPGAPILPAGTQYPRHYGRPCIIDDTSIPGYTLVHVATVTDGAWRLKVRNSDWTCVEQVQYPGTAGQYVSSLCLQEYRPNPGWGNKARLFILVYNGTTPAKPVLCTNANTATGSSLTTSTCSSMPSNVEQMAFVHSSAAGAVSHALMTTNGGVWLSSNADTAAAASVTATNVAGTSGLVPESSSWWFAAGTTETASGQHVFLVGTAGGKRVTVAGQTAFNTVWRGVCSSSSTTPATATSWNALAGASYWSEQVLNLAGATNLWWLAGVNTPGLYGTSAVSAFTTSPSQPSRVYATCKGNTFLSDDAGQTWYPSANFGSSDHNDVAFDWWVNKSYMGTTTGDWPLAVAIDAFPTKTFTAQPHAVLKFNAAAGHGTWFDPRTGEEYSGAYNGAGHSVPTADPNNVLWSLQAADLSNTFTSTAGIKDWALPKDTTVAGAAAATSVMCGVVGYGSSASSPGTILVGRHQGGGIAACNKATGAWSVIGSVSGAAPFTTTPPSSMDGNSGMAKWDDTHHCAYFMQRDAGIVWRIDFTAAGAPQPAVRLLVDPFAYSVTQDGCGYIDVDEVNDRLWIATKNGVYFINGASTAANIAAPASGSSLGAATSVGWAAAFPGEILGGLVYRPKDGTVAVNTQAYQTSTSPIYPVNGADGPRFLVVSNPTSPASWSPSAAVDWAVTRDRGYRLGFTYPKTIARNFDGSTIAVSQQGSGLGVWSD